METKEFIQKEYQTLKNVYRSGITMPISFRIQKLQQLERAVQKMEPEIYDALHKDLNKSKTESYMTEISIVLDEIRFIICHLKKWMRPEKRLPARNQLPGSLSVHREPYGLVLVMSPWNYPFQLTLTPLIGAVAAGNAVLVKPSAYAPATTSVIRSLCADVFSEHSVSVIAGGREENNMILDFPYDYIFFTGSPMTGRVVMEKAARNLTPVTLELGGKSPCIVDETADIEKTAKRIVFGKLTNAGQTCVAPDYIYVQERVKEKLIQALLLAMEKAIPSATYFYEQFAKIINRKHYRRLEKLLTSSTPTVPNLPEDVCFANPETEQFFPCLIIDPDWEDPIMQEEIFGPVLPILSWKSKAEMFQKQSQLKKPLALYLFSTDSSFLKEATEKISSGGVCINDTLVHMASSKAPFGGIGNSGMGQYHGKASFDTFTHSKTILKKSLFFDIPDRHPPYTETSFKRIRRLLGFPH